MKSPASLAYIAFAVIAPCLVDVANAQSAGPYYDNSIHQSAGGRDSRGFPKYYERSRTSGAFNRSGPAAQRRSTVGSGRTVPESGPFYSNTIHQSAGERDSRGFPKYCTGGKC
jgi:hypothetical protein